MTPLNSWPIRLFLVARGPAAAKRACRVDGLSFADFSLSQNAEAYMVIGILEASGVACYLKDNHFLSIHSMLTHAVGGIKIAVESRHAAQAREVLVEHLQDNNSSGKISPFD